MGIVGLGEAVKTYDPDAFWRHYRWRPGRILGRATRVVGELGFVGMRVYFKEGTVERRAVHFRRSLSRLGPAYIKLGQALSTRPDLVPPAVAEELAKLQDRLPPERPKVVKRMVEAEIGRERFYSAFVAFPEEPVAAASLGQVHRATLRGGVPVAVKVQRPNLGKTLAVDALVLRFIARGVSRWQARKGMRRDWEGVVDNLVGRVFEEADYDLEGRNMAHFRKLFAERKGRSFSVAAPRSVPELSTRRVLTMEWLDGVKLTDPNEIHRLNLDAQAIINMGVRCSLHQLLDAGFMHADPHPGNLMAALDGSLVYFDFGSCLEMPPRERAGMLRGLVNFVNRDGPALASDLLDLGFMPPGTEPRPVAQALEEAFQRRDDAPGGNFLDAVRKVATALRDYDFATPSYYARLMRALASLEGTAKRLDPSFQVFERAYPYVLSQILTDRSDEMRRVLSSLIVTEEGRVRWARLARLVNFASGNNTDRSSPSSSIDQSHNAEPELESMQESVVEALLEAADFLASERGKEVREGLAKDVSEAISAPSQSRTVDWEQAVNAARGALTLARKSPGIWLPALAKLARHSASRSVAAEVAKRTGPALGARQKERVLLAVSSPLRRL